MEKKSVSIFWFRRDLRLFDNAGLYHALKSGHEVLPVFIFDTDILDELPARDARLQFIWEEVNAIKRELEDKYGSSLLMLRGKPLDVFHWLLQEYDVQGLFANRDHEPYALERDREVYELFRHNGLSFKGYKDQVLLERNEVLKDDGRPYTVYSPYMRRYKTVLNDFHLKSYPTLKYASAFVQTAPFRGLSMEEIGFEPLDIEFPSRDLDEGIVSKYADTRDIPSIRGTTRLSVHLRFGTISIRQLASKTMELSPKYFNELIWRDFYQMILYHFPHTVEHAFRPEYEHIPWSRNEEHFKSWCEGRTGYALVDAGMRELNATGFMHNRVRMLVASFLTKHLLIDWRWGEAYFAEKLLDYDLASNVGGWQWAAGCGVDAAPYFRVFNPHIQLEKFDKDLRYVKQWVPEHGTPEYPDPIVEHKAARELAIATYKAALA